MKKWIALLKNCEKLSGWKVFTTKTTSYELFFVHEKLETARATDTTKTDVTIYVEHDGAVGDSSFSVFSSDSDDQLKEKIEKAASRALLVSNEPYTLPKGEKGAYTLETNMSGCDKSELAAQIAKAVFSAESPEGGSINALEVFIYEDEISICSSEGMEKSEKKCRVMIEAIPTFTDEKESVELYEDYRFTIFDPEKLQKEIAEKLREAADRHIAVKPKTPMKVHVLLRPQEIRELLSEISYNLSYSSVYRHANIFSIGDNLQEGATGDKISFTMRAATPGSERSAHFDEDGSSLVDTKLIDEGIVQSYFGSDRYAQYLKLEKPSGNLHCTYLAPGTMTDEELKSAPYIECASLSGLQVDLYNDYIGGEIRLAYYFDGEKTIPVSGITMSARLSDVLKTLRLSNTSIIDGAYEGASALLMQQIDVL